MKNTFIIFAMFLMGCATRKSITCGDWRDVNRHDRKPFKVQMWMQQRSDGYWIVTTVFSNKVSKVLAFECRPNCDQLKAISLEPNRG